MIKKAYQRHRALSDKSKSFPPSLSVKDLERIGTPYHYPPKDFVDRVAFNLMKFLRRFVHAFFREKYDHHAVCLETVAAVPGLVASFHRHLRSLRRMKRDHGCKSFHLLTNAFVRVHRFFLLVSDFLLVRLIVHRKGLRFYKKKLKMNVCIY